VITSIPSTLRPDMSDDYTIHHSSPTPTEHIHIRTTSGLTSPPPSRVASALSHSLHCLVARTNTGEAVGMVRLIGDGALFLQIVDMCVHPDHQGRGLGKRLLDGMLAWVDGNCQDAYVSLIADDPGERLYSTRGFVRTTGVGMRRSKWGK